MKYIIYIIICIVAITACVCKRLPADTSNVKETIKYVEKEVLKDTTIYIQLPGEVKYIETKDTSSCLETSVAKSSAMVSGGILHHSLENRTDYKPEVIIQYKDREVIRDTTIYKEVKTPYPVEKELTWWENFRMTIGGWCFAIIIGGVAFFAIKKFVFNK